MAGGSFLVVIVRNPAQNGSVLRASKQRPVREEQVHDNEFIIKEKRS